MTFSWKRATVGGGGFVSGIDVTINAGVITKICWADACGAYKYNNTSGIWDQLINRGSFPSTVVGGNLNNGGGHWRSSCYAGAIAPSDPTRMYIAFEPAGPQDPQDAGGAVFISSDGGASFIKTTGWGTSNSAFYGNYDVIKQTQRKMSVDPVNADVVYVGYPNGRVSYDAGATWAAVPSVTNPSATAGGRVVPMCGFCFDTTSGTVTNTGGSGVRTARVYLVSPGNGVWKSEDGGVTFAHSASSPDIGGAGGSTINCSISTDGVYYVADKPNLHRFTASSSSGLTTNTWVDISPGGGFSCVDVCASPISGHAGKVVTAHDGGNFRQAVDYGVTWTGSGLAANSDPAFDPKWHSVTDPFFAQACLRLDPTTDGLLWVTSGIGVHTYQIPGSGIIPSPVLMKPACFGIEELVIERIISPPGGRIFTGGWDRPIMEIFRDGTTYPSTYYPNYILVGSLNNGRVITFTNSLDWASADPTFLVAIPGGGIGILGGYSSNGGSTWTQWTLAPSGAFLGNQVAAGSSTVQMIVQGGGGDVWYTTDNWATVCTRITATQWNAAGGLGTSHMVDAAVLTISAIASGTGSVFRLTVNAVGTLLTGDRVWLGGINSGNSTGAFLALDQNISYVITKIDSTHIELQGTTFGGTYSGSGATATARPGWGGSYFDPSMNICVDRVASNTFYIPNGSIAGAGGGMFKVTFPAGVLTISRTGIYPPHGITQMKCVPNLTGTGSVSGHIWICGNQYVGAGGFARSSDEGATWSVVQGCATSPDPGSCVEGFGFGANAPGVDHPSVYAFGMINGTYGVYRGDNNISVWNANSAVNWVPISADQPTISAVSPISSQNQTDQIIAVSGDSNIYGQCYLGMGGMNTVFYSADSSGPVTPAFGFSVITDSGQRRTRMIGY